MSYTDFIRGKVRRLQPMGFDVDPATLPPMLIDWQAKATSWFVRRGRAAALLACGMGKTPIQLAWAQSVAEQSGGPVMIHCPIGVRAQTKRESEKFGIRVPTVICNSQADVQQEPMIALANYEKLHKFDPKAFRGVVLDESGILKNYVGVTKRALCDAYNQTPYRLACTATPAPNDYMELGNQAEFLGVMPSNEMLSRWFINDTMKAGGYRLRRHGREDFWQWVCSWAICMAKPSDLGDEYDDSQFELPPLTRHDYVIDVDYKAPEGWLIDTRSVNATTIHSVKRESCEARAIKVAELIRDNDGPWLVWCDTDYESSALTKAVKSATDDYLEVRGSQPESEKERRLFAFANGESRVLITKPEIAGLGMNFQHCCNVAFVGLSYSFERYYQAVRRSWRFGQTRPVHVHVVTTEVEQQVDKCVSDKEAEHELMYESMATAIRQVQIDTIRGELKRDAYKATKTIKVPTWLQSANV